MNPPGLFVKIVRGGLFGFCTLADEDRARIDLRRALYPKHSPERKIDSTPNAGLYGGGRKPPPELSDDARFVRDISNVLRAKGIPESSVWRLVSNQRPEWTRQRWDAALSELSGDKTPERVLETAGCDSPE